MKIKGVTKWWLTFEDNFIYLRSDNVRADQVVRMQWKRNRKGYIKAYWNLFKKRVQYANASTVHHTYVT